MPSGGLWIRPAGLLFEEGIKYRTIDHTLSNGLPLLFPNGSELGFDLFSASFYLLSRYEEYLPFEKDLYGRFPHTGSIAFTKGFLDRPLVNEWFSMLCDRLGLVSKQAYQFQPTYDIDEAYSLKHKSAWRTWGGSFRDLLQLKWGRVGLRWKVISGKARDPFDSFDWLHKLHQAHASWRPIYFFHVAASNGKFDKNNLPHLPAMQKLIREHAEKYRIGLHPSWQSGGDKRVLLEEKNRLESISGKPVTCSRQHFIRMQLPETYRLLTEAGIREDHSMGYGTINGFRASTSSPFYWYDLLREETTSLKLYPFCFMDANSYYELRHSPADAAKEMRSFREKIKAVGGTMETIWHNTYLGTDPMYAGWKEVYREFAD